MKKLVEVRARSLPLLTRRSHPDERLQRRGAGLGGRDSAAASESGEDGGAAGARRMKGILRSPHF